MADSVDAQATLLDGDSVPAGDVRREILGGIYPNAGVVSGLGITSIPTPDMKVRVPSGLCVVDDGAGGFVPLYLATQTDLDIAASSPTLARIDSVIAEVVDTGDGDTLLRRFRVVTGTPASSPVQPALPASDQPTGLTLRLANVAVRANAETGGNIRSQDVTVVAAAAPLVPRPVQSLQVTTITNPSVTTGDWHDFTSGQWPSITFKVPASGMAYLTVGADCEDTATSTSTCRVSFRMSGGYTLASDFGRDVGGHLAHTASRRYLVSGMTPGASVTVTPTFRITNVGASHINAGNLIVEPVA